MLVLIKCYLSCLNFALMQDRQEYEDAAEILRHDLADAQKRNSQLKSIIASRNNGDIDRITQECARSTEKVRLHFHSSP